MADLSNMLDQFSRPNSSHEVLANLEASIDKRIAEAKSNTIDVIMKEVSQFAEVVIGRVEEIEQRLYANALSGGEKINLALKVLEFDKIHGKLYQKAQDILFHELGRESEEPRGEVQNTGGAEA